MKRLLLSSAVLALIAGPGIAQELTFGQVQFDYTDLSVDGGDEITSSQLDAEAEMTFDRFLLGAYFTNGTLDFDGMGELTIRTYGVSGGYMPTPEALVGLGLTGLSYDEGGSDESFNGYEAFAQYRTDQFGLAISLARPDSDILDGETISTFFGEAEVTPGVTLGAAFEKISNADFGTYVLSAEYEQGPIFGRLSMLGFTGDASEDTFTVLRGTYEFTQSIRAIAAYETANVESGFDTSSFAVGAGYRIVDGVWIDATFGQIDGSGPEKADILRLGISYAVGARARLDREVHDDIRDDGAYGIRGIYPEFGLGINPFPDS